MNIMKRAPAGDCWAKRCPKKATGAHRIDGKVVPFCDRHMEMAPKFFTVEVDAEVVDAEVSKDVADCFAPKCEQVAVGFAVLDGVGRKEFCEKHLNDALDNHAIEDAGLYEDGAQPAPELAPEPEAKPKAELALTIPEKELAEETEEAKDALALVKTLTIESQEDLDFANETLREAKARAKALKARLDEITKPLNSALKSARDLFRPAMNYYGEIETILKGHIAERKLREEEANRKAMLAAADAAAEGDNEAVTEALSNVTTLGEVEGLSTRRTWDFIVEDPNLVPREYLMVNEKALGAYARSAKDSAPAPIPGVKFVPKVVVVSRSG